MTYSPSRGAGSAIFTEFSCTTNSVNSSAFRWDSTTKRSTGTTNVSVDTATGEITLPAGACYWLIASLDVTRASTSAPILCRWLNAQGSTIGSLQGGSRISVTSSTSTSANSVAQLCVDVPPMGPSHSFYLQEYSGSTHTPNTTMTLIIMEVR